MHLQAVKAVKGGQGVTQVGTALRVNVYTDFRWLATYASGGTEGAAGQADPMTAAQLF